ncbi:DMT family transporter [Methylobrevis pamukkalensis]|uniref:Putative DMT superfamily transporter inner membrane protein n=1 Tax=Methylobrevis pamukkalensis TaxID=1439726 RepID=A0A1E3GWY2_9HYPH|nr:DMT family transporter [Methylobrevis pamukkalensis]ODN68569.1 putative DMT superfamily transporter inner membrane protein [Methylobrevis pamukkalensis]
MTARPATLLSKLYDSPYVMLTLAPLFWAGNVITGRLAVGEVSPMALTTLRWAVVGVIIVALGRGPIRQDWHALKPRLGYLAVMGTLGFTAFNALYYIAAHFTTAVNIGILQGAIPILVFGLAFFLRGTPVGLFQIAGMTIGLVGVVVVATRGDLGALAALAFNFGDVLMMGACVVYAIFTALLPNRPATSGFSFFAMLALFALLTSFPPLVAEIAMGQFVWPSFNGWLAVIYTAIFPSVASQVFFIRGVELIGPGRAGIFVNLIPVFAAGLAVAILREPFHVYHAAALALVLGGIFLAERGRRPPLPGGAAE